MVTGVERTPFMPLADRTHRQVSAMRRIKKAHATQSQVELLALLQRERYRLVVMSEATRLKQAEK